MSESRVCSVERCNCVDFLPFECSLCGEVYCLDHRSRFSHACSGVNLPAPVVPVSHSSGPSVKDMMKSVETRFDGVKNGNNKGHYNVKTSTDTLPPIDEKFTKKLHTLDHVAEHSKNQKQRKISLKAREMLIKKNATGNSSIAGADRHFMCVHFAASMEEAEADPHHKMECLFFSSTKPLGEALQQIWQKYQATLMNTTMVKENESLRGVSAEDLTVVLTTIDTAEWKKWDRNWLLQDCLANYEDVAVCVARMDEVVANQTALAAARDAPMDIVEDEAAVEAQAAARQAEVHQHMEELRKVVYVKEQLAWYYKVSLETAAALGVEEMERSQPMVMVKITGVHHDDFPNIYYSVRMAQPPRFTPVQGSTDLLFTHEKQTDAAHLLVPPVGNKAKNPAGSAAAERAEREGAAHLAAQQLQATLADNGTPVAIKVGFSNRDYCVTIGSLCTVAQLKLLISTITEVAVPDMKLIVKGTVLKNNNQLIKDTKITHNSKVVVMSSNAHTV